MKNDNKLKIFCLTLNPDHLGIIKNIGYIPVGLGNADFDQNWLNDKSDINISHKNKFYGEYTFHYWLWKNNKIQINNWVGFCQYRKFWQNESQTSKTNSLLNFKNSILQFLPLEKIDNCECILTEEIFINKFKLSKFLKKNFKKFILNPKYLLIKESRTIKFHFDLMHGEGNLNKAIKLLPLSERSDFNDFVNKEVSFNAQNMFICKNKDILFKYYESVFPWLFDCEKIFGFNKLNTYGTQRIYAFLAERYLSYWFRKYVKFRTNKIIFKDITDFL